MSNLYALDNMTNKLTESLAQADPTSYSPLLDSIQPGLVCCTFADDQWFRVLVLESPASASSNVSTASLMHLVQVQHCVTVCTCTCTLYMCSIHVHVLPQ